VTPRLHDDRGSASLMFAVMGIALLLAIGLVVDGGAKIRAVQSASSAAAEAARAGAQQVDVAAVQTAAGIVLQPQRAQRAAEATLAASGATGWVRADRTEVQVRATVSSRTVFLGLVGIDEVQGSGEATARLTVVP
jgi:Flp pilus assembly protein TadG